MSVYGNRDSYVVVNGSTTTYTYDSNVANEYTQVVAGGVTHTPLYDDASNITRDAQGYYHSYDYENRLIQVKDTNNSNTVAQYTYDALGRRIEFINSDAGVTNRYYYDGWRVLSETDEDGDLVYSYVYGNNLDEVLMRETWAGLADYYYVHDHLFSPVAIISDGLDAVVERYEYDAYGKCNIWDATFANSRSVSSFGNTIAFTGQRLDRLDDGNLLIMYYKNRIYVIALGRFAQRDPIGIKDEMSLFEFAASGNPKLPRKFEPDKQYTDGMCLYEYVKSNSMINLDTYGLYDYYEPSDPKGLEGKRGRCGCYLLQLIDKREMGHKWIECGNRSWGHSTRGAPAPGDSPDVDAENRKIGFNKNRIRVWKLRKKESGYLHYFLPISCKCENCRDIVLCLDQYREIPLEHKAGFLGLGKKTCWEWAESALDNCCLKKASGPPSTQ